ncbi:unnamed protein product [Vicia faba]|uniref:Uncharacterized protein n=1 Tax=Vicia faba TaxID=3906 RepID=A0AAV0YRU7_VICFA|nr:unnamed protein product [Vicia faba]
MEASKILLFSSISTSKLHTNHSNHPLRKLKSHQMRLKLKITSMAKEETDTNIGIAEKAAIAGPGGSIGALEGISYLVVVGIVAWSIYTKSKTGSGLPNGPFGLLGAVEGLSYLALVAIVVAFGLQYFEQGYIPGPLPADQCFG